MKNTILPIGSIIKMQNSDSYLMIYGYANSHQKIEDKYYDYICCIYPTGIDGKNTILVQKEKIEKIVFIGYQGVSFAKFIELMNENKNNTNTN